jgi:hypothetical protein
MAPEGIAPFTSTEKRVLMIVAIAVIMAFKSSNGSVFNPVLLIQLSISS